MTHLPSFHRLSFAVVGLAIALAFSPVADKLAGAMVRTPPTLGVFRALQRSTKALVLGIVLAWVLGGFVEEYLLRALLLRAVEDGLSDTMPRWLTSSIAVCVAALAAGVGHLYQGRRGALIIAQLSLIFGGVYVVSGHDLATVVLCHGLYDTIAFVRFAAKRSKYSGLERAPNDEGTQAAIGAMPPAPSRAMSVGEVEDGSAGEP
jgi:membrane protease YdiL (CAAX protease family)